MKGYPKKAVLKDGSQVLIRALEPLDMKALHGFFNGLPLDTRLCLREDVADSEVVERWMKEFDQSHILPLIALEEERIIADATLRQPRFGWGRHVGEVRVVVDPEFQGLGLASILINELVHEAARRGIDKIIGMFMEEQFAARRILEKVGFRQEAVLRKHVKDIHGKKHDLIVLSQDVEELWRRFEDFLRVRALRMEY